MTVVLMTSANFPLIDARTWQLWGKADPKRKDMGPPWHPLLCHVLDVVACAALLLDEVHPERIDRYADVLQLSRDQARAWALFAIGLHDLGKASPPFQGKVPDRAEALRALGLDFPHSDEPHGALSAVLVPPELEQFGCPRRIALRLAAAVAAHHGDFPTSRRIDDLGGVSRHVGHHSLWNELRRDLVSALASVTGLDGMHAAGIAPRAPETDEARNALCADLAGLTAVADWLGSNADIFRYEQPPQSARAYFDFVATERAALSLAEAGFRRPPRPKARSFGDLFGPRTPWPLHDATARILDEIAPGSLVVIEAPMGEGKTEAGLLLYDTLAASGADGLYFALPTQATANQILGRVDDYLTRSFRGQTHGLHLVHGGAGLSARYEALKERAFATRSVGDVARSPADEGPIADAWFARSKRALLAPMAVGTVDQALLGVLRSKHHFLRLHGLARKVVIVDEVHAYDTYTAEILARLCAWLRALGSAVVLLSATLSSPQRARLLQAYGVATPPDLPIYPRITLARDGVVRSEPFVAHRPPVEVAIEWIEENDLARAVVEAVAAGGCVAWIVNTVARAQAIYRALQEMKTRGELSSDLELTLLHARFPFESRQARERVAEAAFGPPGKATSRPRAAILVGTQVLEQSLDLDFDLMVTDLAPIDLVLQRAGRLHRHDGRSRPAGLQHRRLWIARPSGGDRPEGPCFGASVFVYEEAALLRSWLALAPRASVTLPDDIEPLVEMVYAPRNEDVVAPALAARLMLLEDAAKNRHRSDAASAGRRELPDPAENNPFGDFAVRFDEDDPRIHEELRAVTRLGEPSVTVVPLVRRQAGVFLLGGDGRAIDLDGDTLSFADVLALARQTVSISRRQVVVELLRDAAPRCFQRSGHLRHHRPLFLDDSGRTVVGGISLHLDPALGLVVGELDPTSEPS